MLRASRYFTESDRAAIREALRCAESGTAAGIVPVAATISGAYAVAVGRAGMAFGAIAVAGAWVCRAQLGGFGFPHLISALLAGYLLGAALAALLSPVRRAMTTRREMALVVHTSAREALAKLRAPKVRDGPGLVIYLSLFERLVAVAADDRVTERVAPREIESVVDAVLAGLRAGEPVRGLADGIRRAGQVLGAPFPPRPDERGALENELRVIG